MPRPEFSYHFAREAAEAIDAQPDVQPIRADVHPLDQQLHDARLLGGEQLVPERIEPLQRLAHLGLGDVVHLPRGPRQVPTMISGCAGGRAAGR